MTAADAGPTLVATPPPGIPAWIVSSLMVTAGRDPLGLDAIAIYRIMPDLLPGILETSRRARYLSFFAYLVGEFRRRWPQRSQADLGSFLAHAEYEYGYAVLTCPRCSATARGVLGEIRLRTPRREKAQQLDRDTSVDDPMGGYGANYRSPLIYLGVITPKDADAGDGQPLAFDRLSNQRARALAGHFGDAVATTAWATRHLDANHSIPVADLIELGQAACLCRLDEAPAERAALLELLTEAPDKAEAVDRADAQLRSRGLAQFLATIDHTPAAATDSLAWRGALWGLGCASSAAPAEAVAQSSAAWGAYAAREVQRAALSALWYAICRLGQDHDQGVGIGVRDFLSLVVERLAGPDVFGLPCDPLQPTAQMAGALASQHGRTTLEDLLRHARRSRRALDAAAVLLELVRRLPDPAAMPAAWRAVGGVDGDHQDGLLAFADNLRQHLQDEPCLGVTLAWLTERYILIPHDRVATAKLPRNTFRFRYEGGRLHFVQSKSIDLGDGALRHDPLSQLSADLGLWEKDGAGSPLVTAAGRALLARVLAP